MKIPFRSEREEITTLSHRRRLKELSPAYLPKGMTKEYSSNRKEILTEGNMDHWEERAMKCIKVEENIIDYPFLKF